MIKSSRLLVAELCMASWMAFVFMLVVFLAVIFIEEKGMAHQVATAQLIKENKIHEASHQLALWTKAGGWEKDPDFYDFAATIHDHYGRTEYAEWNRNKAKELRGN